MPTDRRPLPPSMPSSEVRPLPSATVPSRSVRAASAQRQPSTVASPSEAPTLRALPAPVPLSAPVRPTPAPASAIAPVRPTPAVPGPPRPAPALPSVNPVLGGTETSLLKPLPGASAAPSLMPARPTPVFPTSPALPGRQQDQTGPLTAMRDLLGKILTAVQNQPAPKSPAPGARQKGPAKLPPLRKGGS